MIPLAVVLVNLANFIIDLLFIAPVLILFGKGFGLSWLYLPVLIICEFLLVSGIAVAASGLYVIFRDLNFILNLFLRLFFYFVPVIYSLELVPRSWRFIYLLNPLAVLIDGFNRVLFYGLAPDMKWLGLASLESLGIFILGSWLFSKIKRSIPERL
jgi:ABC-type polysaccharide/polyol phosphate export permease